MQSPKTTRQEMLEAVVEHAGHVAVSMFIQQIRPELSAVQKAMRAAAQQSVPTEYVQDSRTRTYYTYGELHHARLASLKGDADSVQVQVSTEVVEISGLASIYGAFVDFANSATPPFTLPADLCTPHLGGLRIALSRTGAGRVEYRVDGLTWAAINVFHDAALAEDRRLAMIEHLQSRRQLLSPVGISKLVRR